MKVGEKNTTKLIDIKLDVTKAGFVNVWRRIDFDPILGISYTYANKAPIYFNSTRDLVEFLKQGIKNNKL